MNFADPRFVLLASVPILVAMSLAWSRERRRAGRAAFSTRLQEVASGPRWAVRAIVAAACFALAAAGPQWGHGFVETPARGLDVVIVLDASRSMRTRDVAPSRLERAWSEIDALADTQGPWRLGLVRFRGDAEVVGPLTDDHASIAVLARETDPESVPGAGSGMARGVRAALEVFDPDAARKRVVLLLTDGESQGDDDVAAAAAAARSAGVVVIGVLVGTGAGGVVPQHDAPDAPIVLDASGSPATSVARRGPLDVLASATAGRVVDLASDAFAMRRVVDDELRSRMPTAAGFAREWRPIDRSAWFVALGLFFVVPWWGALRRARFARGFAMVALLGCVPWMLGADDAAELGRDVNGAFARGAPQDAVAALEALAAATPGDARVAFDLGLAYLRTGALPAARDAFERAAAAMTGPQRAAARHGVALAVAKLAQFEEARGADRLEVADALLVEARSALVASLQDADDAAARSNLDVVTFRLERVRAQRASGSADAGSGATGASGKPEPDASGSANAGSSGATAGGSGTTTQGRDDSGGAGRTEAGSPGEVDGGEDSPRLPGGMFRAEAESIADVVRRFERERRAFDRERAASSGRRGGNDW